MYSIKNSLFLIFNLQLVRKRLSCLFQFQIASATWKHSSSYSKYHLLFSEGLSNNPNEYVISQVPQSTWLIIRSSAERLELLQKGFVRWLPSIVHPVGRLPVLASVHPNWMLAPAHLNHTSSLAAEKSSLLLPPAWDLTKWFPPGSHSPQSDLCSWRFPGISSIYRQPCQGSILD